MLDFLKKHYEKIMLAALLLVFILSLIYLINIINSTNEITKEDLMIPTQNPDYVNVDFNSADFDTKIIFTTNSEWKPTGPREPSDLIYTDLVIPFKIARCPHCGYLVPEYDFLNAPHKCQICSGNLPRPVKTTIIRTTVITNEADIDGDGIPNNVEEKLGLDPKNPDDASEDMDNDGFSNLFEYLQKYRINDPKSHPPMYKRLHLVDLRKTVLDVMLKKLTLTGTNKANWDIQVNTDNGNKTKFLILGDELSLDNRYYKVVDIIPKKTKVQKGNVSVDVDESQVLLKSTDGKYEILMQFDKPVYSPNPKAIVKDISNDKEYQLDEDDKFSIGTNKTGISKYKVVKVDNAKETVIINDSKGKTYEITKDLQMSKIARPKATEPTAPDGAPVPQDQNPPPGNSGLPPAPKI